MSSYSGGPIGPLGGSGEPNTGQPFEGANLVRSGFGVVGTTTGGGGVAGTCTTGTAGTHSDSLIVNIESPVIDELKARITELEKKIEGAGSLLDQMPRLEVGPNDILVIHLDVADIPTNRVEAYMVKAKKSLGDVFAKRGLKGRVLWVPTRERETGFSVIGVNDREQHLARALPKSATVKKYPPPVMG